MYYWYQSSDLEVKVRLMIMHRQVVVSAMFMMMILISVFFAITHFDKPTLKEFLGFESLTIPNYDRVMKFVFDLHRRLPYFDLVGWDIALDVNNEPVFIEMNLTAESGFAQMNGGPLFGKYLDEVMERVSKVHKDYRNSVEMKFENGSRLMMKV